ncbi:MAG TPA: ABC transporter permease [Vicinamibacterales bacterium]|nr:ABC transporter permease [Vicinamibacterales bacterium]
MSIKRFFYRSRWDDERARELEAHLAIETDDNIARGMAPEDARLAAQRKLGNRTLVREQIYQMNTISLLDSAWRDFRYGLRLLRLNPSFAIVAILSLALGVGANTAIFQLLDAVRLRTLPVNDPQQLVEVRIGDATGGRTGSFTSRRPMLTNPLWEQIRDHQQAFSSAFAYSNVGFNLTTGGEARYAQGVWASGEFFSTLGVPALIGRTLTSDDDRRGCAAPPAVIGYGFWRREYAGSPSAIGRSIMLDGHSYDIVGVMPASFFGLEVGRTFDVIVPLCAEPLSRGARSNLDKPDSWFLAAFGRLKPDWTIERATAHLAAISPPMFQTTLPTRYVEEEAKRYLNFKLQAFAAGTGVSQLRRNYESPLWLLLATTGLVLLIACANLANLMLARATAREREVAVRLAIGASRGRIVRQMLAESLLIAAIGAASGAVLAQWLSRFLVGFLNTDNNQIFVALALDWRIFAFTSALAVATCLIFGLMPAMRATGTAPGLAMKSGSRGSTDTRERFGLRRALVVVQVALSLVLVVGALLFVRSLRNLMTLDAGFAQDGIVIANLDLRRTGTPSEQLPPVFEDITTRLASLPGVLSAAQAFIVPVSGSGWNNSIVINGTKPKSAVVNFNSVSAGYFKTMGTPILRGRDFDDRIDTAASAKVAIVTESFVKKYFEGQNPIGQAFQIEEPPGVPRPLYQIVGVAKDTKYTDLREPFGPIGFFPSSQADPKDVAPFLQVVLRSNAPLTTITSQVSAAVTNVNRSIVLQFQTMQSQVRDSLLRERLMATLSGFFGALAGLIATIGLYGVMSYMVARRRNEIGIRMALGADRRDVVRMVMREAGVLLGAGLIVGGVMAVLAARTASTLLFGLHPGDPATLAMSAIALAAVAMLASYLPALRAARLEPTEALRDE